ncbi:MAG: hypothetical protein KUG69_15205 [Marinosulfonomonas sp.]|nr:hypothetical protein [Marinosulfonomonas sp.]
MMISHTERKQIRDIRNDCATQAVLETTKLPEHIADAVLLVTADLRASRHHLAQMKDTVVAADVAIDEALREHSHLQVVGRETATMTGTTEDWNVHYANAMVGVDSRPLIGDVDQLPVVVETIEAGRSVSAREHRQAMKHPSAYRATTSPSATASARLAPFHQRLPLSIVMCIDELYAIETATERLQTDLTALNVHHESISEANDTNRLLLDDFGDVAYERANEAEHHCYIDALQLAIDAPPATQPHEEPVLFTPPAVEDHGGIDL